MRFEAYDRLLEVTRQIDSEWRRVDNDCEAFAAVVWRLSAQLDLSAFGDLSRLPELLRIPHVAALQHPSTFSDLYFKLFDNGRFWIEVLNWWGSDINVHDHNFSGVQFQLTGRSLNVVYRFDPLDELPDITLGTLSVARAEVWAAGARSIVRPGAVEPHNVSHLDVPTVSLLIRTHPVAAYGHQSNYLAPHVAGNYGVADIVFRKKIGALRLLSKGAREPFHRAFRSVLQGQTHAENLFTLAKLLDIIFEPAHLELVHEYAAAGPLEEQLVQAVAYHRAQDVLTNSLKYTPGLSADEILFLSVLASSFDARSFEAILLSLNEAGHAVAPAALCASVRAKLPQAQRRQFDNILQLFSIELKTERALAPTRPARPNQPLECTRP